MIKLVLLRHGESLWNKENRFTGWTDIDLSVKGVSEARRAGKILKSEGYHFDVAYSSVLVRAIHTLEIVLHDLGMKVPVYLTWRLNERHYGALQGLNKGETAQKYGEEQVHIWRRSYTARPPALKADDPRYPGFDEKYNVLLKKDLPLTECLKDTYERVMPYWNTNILKSLEARKHVLVAAHGNSLRAIVKHLEDLSDAEIEDVELPTGIPLVYELDDKIKPMRHYYLDK